MIPIEQRVVAIFFSLLLFAVTVQLVRQRRLREEYALLWLFASGGILVLAIFGRIVPIIASMLKVSYAPTIIFALGVFFIIAISLLQTVATSSLADNTRDLCQEIALLEFRVRSLEKQLDSAENNQEEAPIYDNAP